MWPLVTNVNSIRSQPRTATGHHYRQKHVTVDNQEEFMQLMCHPQNFLSKKCPIHSVRFSKTANSGGTVVMNMSFMMEFINSHIASCEFPLRLSRLILSRNRLGESNWSFDPLHGDALLHHFCFYRESLLPGISGKCD